MSAIFNGYLAGEEREVALENAMFENEINKLNTLLSMVILEEEQCIRDAELRVFSESGTYDDFTYLVEEVTNESNEKKQNIFARIWNAIKNFFSRIFGKTKEIQDAQVEEVEVPENYESAASTIEKAGNDISAAASAFFSNPTDGVKKIGIALGAVIALAGGTAIAMKKMPKEKADAITAKINAGTNKIKAVGDKIAAFFTGGKGNNDPQAGQESGNIFQKALSAIKGVVDKVKTGAAKAADNVKDAAQDVVDKVTHKQDKIDAANRAASEQLNKNGVESKTDKHGNTVVIDKVTGKKTYYDKDGKEFSPIDNSLQHDERIDKRAQQLKGKAAAKHQEKIDARQQAEIDKHKTGELVWGKDSTGGPTVAISNAGKIYVGGKPVQIQDSGLGKVLNPKKTLTKILQQKGVDGSVASRIASAYLKSRQGIKAADKERENMNRTRKQAGMTALGESVEENEHNDLLFAQYLLEAGFELDENNNFILE